MRKLAEQAQLEPGKTEGILQGSVDLGGDPRESHSTTGAGHFELVSAKLKPMDFLANWASCSKLTNFNCSSLLRAHSNSTALNVGSRVLAVVTVGVHAGGIAVLLLGLMTCKELTYMPGSQTTQGHPGTRTIAPVRVAFRQSDGVGTLN